MNKPIAKAIFITSLMLAPIGGLQADSSAATSGDVVTVDAKPEPIAINPKNTAVIVVDMENDFATKGGMFDRAGVDISGAQKVIAPTAKVLAAARAAGMKIIYLRMAYQPDLSDLGAPDSVNRTRHLKFGVGQTIRAPDGRESRILIRDTWDTDIVDELKPQPGDITFPILKRLCGPGLVGTDDQAMQAMALAFTHLRIVLEPGGAVALAAAMFSDDLPDTVICTASGGNVDAQVFSKALLRFEG